MKIAFLTAKPNIQRNKYVGEKRPPHGIGFLYSILKSKGIEVDIYDRYCGNITWPSDDFANYDIIGIYCASICTDDILYIINKIKAKKIIVGGPHAYLHPEWFPDKVSHIVRGEAEHIIYNLILEKINDKIINTNRLSNIDLDSIPRFPFEDFYNRYRKYYDWNFVFHNISPIFTFNTSRGCPYNCSFCSVRKIWGRKYTYMSAKKIIDDIKYVISLGAKGVYFREDNFTINNKRVIEFCKYLITNNIKISWACETRVDTIDYELMKLMNKAGCIGFYVGVEHLSDHMLEVFNKQTTVNQILKFFENTYKLNIKTAASFIVKHPEETEKDRKEKERLLPIIKPDIIWNNLYRAEG